MRGVPDSKKIRQGKVGNFVLKEDRPYDRCRGDGKEDAEGRGEGKSATRKNLRRKRVYSDLPAHHGTQAKRGVDGDYWRHWINFCEKGNPTGNPGVLSNERRQLILKFRSESQNPESHRPLGEGY